MHFVLFVEVAVIVAISKPNLKMKTKYIKNNGDISVVFVNEMGCLLWVLQIL